MNCLESAERRLSQALVSGEVFGTDATDQSDWPVVRAVVIRDLLRTVDPAIVADPQGLRLRHVRVVGRLDLDRVETRIALELDECTAPEGLTARNSRLSALTLRGLRIRRTSADEAVLHLENAQLDQVNLTGTTLTNPDGPALRADGLTVGSSAFLDEGFTAEGRGEDGAVRLLGATINGSLSLKGAKLTNPDGPALRADRLTVGSSAFLDEGFTAEGRGKDGAVRLLGATINDQLSLKGAKLTNPDGPALRADWLTVGSSAFLYEGFTAEGRGEDGAVRLLGATINGSLFLKGAKLTNPDGPALRADSLTVRQDLLISLGGWKSLDSSAGLPFANDGAEIVTLAGASIGSRLYLSPVSLPTAPDAAATHGTWDITGLTYGTLAAPTPRVWLEFLKYGTRSYSPQPYQQLAAVTRLEGEEELTRRALIAQHNDQLSRSQTEPNLLSGREKMKKQLLGFTVGYGYQTWKALLGLLAVIVLAFGVAIVGGDHRFPVQALALIDSDTGAVQGPCRAVDLWALALETVPLVGGHDTACAPTTTLWGELYFVVSTALKVIAWALLTLFIAGYTNIIRRPGP